MDSQESGHPIDRTVISIDQRGEIPLRTLQTRHAQISYLYARSSESRSNDVEGQDYLTFRYDDRAISFAVCDGVGQSFCGQLAAEFLGTPLVTRIGELDPAADADGIRSAATDFLNELTDVSRQQVLEYALPEGLPPLIEAALEEQRAYGSETMFACGRLLLPQDPADPSQTGQLLLCWLGDTEIQVFDQAGQPIDIGAKWTSHERWSMSSGIKGVEEVHVWVSDLSQIGRIIAHSDGLSSVADRLYELVDTPEVLQQETERIYRSPESDDISLTDIRLRVIQSPVLVKIRNPLLLGSYKLWWSPVHDAGGYVVEEASDPDFGDVTFWVTKDTSLHVRGVRAGRHAHRVKAMYGGVQSEYSNVLWTRTLPVTLRLALHAIILLACLVVARWLARVTWPPR